MKINTKLPLALAFASLLTATGAQAKPPAPGPLPQHLGAGGGALAGAVLGGPLGLIIGGSLGALIGQDQAHQQQARALSEEQAKLQEQLAATDRELDARRQALTQAQRSLATGKARLERLRTTESRLRKEHQNLRTLVDGLKFSLYFDHDSSSLTQHQKTRLLKLSQDAAPIPGLNFSLKGFTDAAGSSDYNRRLSHQRGEAVGSHLQAAGLAPRRLDTSDLAGGEIAQPGPYSPRNRRVDLMFQLPDPVTNKALSSR